MRANINIKHNSSHYDSTCDTEAQKKNFGTLKEISSLFSAQIYARKNLILRNFMTWNFFWYLLFPVYFYYFRFYPPQKKIVLTDDGKRNRAILKELRGSHCALSCPAAALPKCSQRPRRHRGRRRKLTREHVAFADAYNDNKLCSSAHSACSVFFSWDHFDLYHLGSQRSLVEQFIIFLSAFSPLASETGPTVVCYWCDTSEPSAADSPGTNSFLNTPLMRHSC